MEAKYSLLLAVSFALSSVSDVLLKKSSRIPPSRVIFWRSLGCLLPCPFVLPFVWQNLHLTDRSVFLALSAGAFMWAANVAAVQALRRTTAPGSTLCVIRMAFTLTIALGVLIDRERIDGVKMIGLALAVIGIYLLSYQGKRGQ